MRAIAIGLVLALAACGGAQENSSNAAAPAKKEQPPAGPMLGAIDLSRPIEAAGERPFWQMRIAPGRITLGEKSGEQPADLYPVTPKIDGGRAIYSTQTPEGVPVKISLVPEPCGPAKRPLQAEAQIGERQLTGCAEMAAGAAPAAAEEATP